jgi:autotransporter-associated beta strand protein
VAGTLSVATLGNAGGGGTNSLLGSGSNAASNIVLTGGTLQYAGSGETTDRLFSVTPTDGGIDSSGTGPISFNNGGAIVSADPASRQVNITANQAGATGSGKLTLPSVADLVTGMHVTGTLIQLGTTITAINPSANSVTLSLPPTAAGSDTLSFPDGIGRSLTLTGTNTGANTLGNVLANSTAGGSLSLVKSGSGTWVLTIDSTYTGTTRVNAGTLKLGIANAIAGATHSNLILNGGTFATGGFNQTMGTLQVLAKSTIDMGSATNMLNLDNSNDSNPLWAWTPNKLLSIANWDGNASDPTSGGGPDKVFIGGGGLSSAQLSQIKFDNYRSGATILASGELVPASSAIVLSGDFNFSGHTDASDIVPMLKALTDLNSFQTINSLSSYDLLSVGDLNLDGAVTNADIQPLLDLVASQPGAGATQAVPEPTSLLLAAFMFPLVIGLAFGLRSEGW